MTTELTAMDESFSHQLVAPFLDTAHRSPAWGDRCYHLLHVDGLTINAGRQLYVHAGRRYAFFGVGGRGSQVCVRAGTGFAAGEDPDQSTIGPVTIEVVEPLRVIRLAVTSELVTADLTFTARFPAVATEPHVVRRDGVVVTDYMNFFQSGYYNGTITVGGRRTVVRDRAGFRDRGWGLRKHEGAPRRGFVASLFAELPDAALYLILFETASGERVFTNGWWLDGTGAADSIVSAEHDLVLEGRAVVGARYDIRFASGAHRTVELSTVSRNYLVGVGYSPEPRFRASGVERFDLTDSSTLELLDGQTDNGCTVSIDGVAGHGYLETGIGVHARYRPG